MTRISAFLRASASASALTFRFRFRFRFRLTFAFALALALLGAFALTAVGCAATQGTVGAVLAQQTDGRLIVHEVPQGLAAAKAGLQPGDEILLVDGIDVRRLDDKSLHRTLAGEVGSPVKLTVVRGEEVLHVTLKRTPAKKRPRPTSP